MASSRQNELNFRPLPGLTSNHLQMVVASLLPPGKAPPSERWLVPIGGGDQLSCEVSTPSQWRSSDPTVVLIHGLGGSYSSRYMIRMARKLYLTGRKVVRVNLRGCGSGRGLSKLLYHAGNSKDLLIVLQSLRNMNPISEIKVIGFSLGGNIILKLAGELGLESKSLVKTFIAVCPPIDLKQVVESIREKRNRLYHRHYLKHIREQAGLKNSQKIWNLYQFDDLFTAPAWGYKGAIEYYQACSSIRFIPQIQQETHILFAKDDPFITFDQFKTIFLPKSVHIWVTEKGGHMGFLGNTSSKNTPYWMDNLLLKWLDDDFRK